MLGGPSATRGTRFANALRMAKVDRVGTSRGRALRSVFVVGLLAFGATTACGDDEERDLEGEYVAALANALCEAHARCCMNVPECRIRMRVERYERGAVTYDRRAGAQCLENIRRAYSDCTLDAQEFEDVYTTCKRAMTGHRQLGEECSSTVECAYDGPFPVECEKPAGSDPATAPQTCMSANTWRPGRGKLGDPCGFSCDDRPKDSGPWVDCLLVGGDTLPGCYASDQLHCGGDPFAPTCQPLPAAGEPCFTFCESGSYCNEDVLECEPKLPEGAPCNHHNECRDNFCDDAGECRAIPAGRTFLCLRVIESIFDAVLYRPK